MSKEHKKKWKVLFESKRNDLLDAVHQNHLLFENSQDRVSCPECRYWIEKTDGPTTGREYVCPHCGKRFWIHSMYTMNSDREFKYNPEQGYQCAYAWYELRYYHNVMENKKDGKLKISVFSLIPVEIGKKLFFRPTGQQLVVNYKQGTAFFIDPEHKHTSILNCTAGLATATSCYGFSGMALKKFSGFLIKRMSLPEELKKKFLDILDSKSTICGNDYTAFVSTLLSYMRCPNYLCLYDSYQDHATILRSDWHRKNMEFYHALPLFPKQLMDTQDWIRKTCKERKLPMSSAFWKLYITDTKYLVQVYYLKRIGIKNPDLMLSFLESEFFDLLASYIVGSSYQPTFLRMLKRMIKVRGENPVTKDLLSLYVNRGGISLLSDAVVMYQRIHKQDPELISDDDFRGTVREMHDRFSRIANHLQYENVELQYPEPILNAGLERNVNGYQFSLAKDTNELVRIGEEMKICVGSAYRDAAISGTSIILSMSKQNKYVGCIELDPKKCLKQIKGPCNRYLSGKTAAAFREWVHGGILRYKNCNDYKMMDEKEFAYAPNTDFHNVKLHDGVVIPVEHQPEIPQNEEMRSIAVNETEHIPVWEEALPF